VASLAAPVTSLGLEPLAVAQVLQVTTRSSPFAHLYDPSLPSIENEIESLFLLAFPSLGAWAKEGGGGSFQAFTSKR